MKIILSFICCLCIVFVKAQTQDTSGWKLIRDKIKDEDFFIKFSPGEASHYYKRAHYKYRIGDQKGAVQDFDKVIELNPTLADAYCARGYSKYLLKELKGSIEDLNKAIELDPTVSFYYIDRGLAKYELRDTKGAIEDYTKVIALDSLSADAYYDRGLSKQMMHEYKEAITDYTKAVQINPKYAVAYDERGASKYETGDISGAIQDNNTAIQLNPRDSSFYTHVYSKGQYLRDSVNYEIIEFEDLNSEHWVSKGMPYEDKEIILEAFNKPGDTLELESLSLMILKYKNETGLDSLMTICNRLEKKSSNNTILTIIHKDENVEYPDILFTIKYMNTEGNITGTRLYYFVIGKIFIFNNIYYCTGNLKGRKLKKRINFFKHHKIKKR